MHSYYDTKGFKWRLVKNWFLLAFVFIFLTMPLQGQWSTATHTDSALYVCPGFFPGIITYDDGSSIVLGALNSYIHAQKLDPDGYNQWIAPVQVHHNDSSAITALQTPWLTVWGGWVSDNNGGVILFWYDHREGNNNPSDGHWYNNAIYAQRVDRNGVVRWNAGGVKIAGPESGLKYGNIVADGKGGCIIAWTEGGFNYPGAPNKQYLRTVRYDSTATLVWSTAIDSSTVESDAYTMYRLLRGGERLYITYYANGNYSRVVDLSGTVITQSKRNSFFTITAENDSIVFLTYYPNNNVQYKLSSLGDTLWIAPSIPSGSCSESGWYFVQDGFGGCYMIISCNDSIMHLDSSGITTTLYFAGIDFGGRAFSDDNHGLTITNSTTAKRFNQSGQMIWDQPVTYLSDPGNAYFSLTASDNNGGVIVVFWTVYGGIYAQHTGRYGKVGLTPVKELPGIPLFAHLYQNYPNPFNPSTIISYSLSAASDVSLKVYDILGREIATLIHEVQEAGDKNIVFDANAGAYKLPSGVYYYRLQTKTFVDIKKMILLY